MEIIEKEWNKLVRDNVCASLEGNGAVVEMRVVRDKKELDCLLRGKLVEESREVESAQSIDEVVEKLADLETVKQALMRLHGISQGRLTRARIKKDKLKGTFGKGHFLISTKERNG